MNKQKDKERIKGRQWMNYINKEKWINDRNYKSWSQLNIFGGMGDNYSKQMH